MKQNGAKSRLKFRTNLVLILILVLGFGAISSRLFYLQIIQGEELSTKALGQQLKDTSISAKRGTIYDATGKVLAKSATVWKVALEPTYFENDEQRKFVSSGLAEILDTDYDKIFEKAQKKLYYVEVANNVESDVKDQILEFKGKVIEKYSNITNVISLIEDYKRYYPYGDFASSVLGFTGYDGQGLWGLEYRYDDVLSGTPGRVLTAIDGIGKTEMPYQYEFKYDADDGNSLVLTIDETVQRIMEKHLKQGIIDSKIYNRGVAVLMNVKTGAILGMAVEGGYDLNDPYTLVNKDIEKEIDKLPENEQSQAYSDALQMQWRNKALSDTYCPGSVFKIITTAIALEEGAATANSSYFCSGSYTPVEGVRPISCHNTLGHGSQNLLQALCNSCNPAFMQIGQAIGAKTFCEYYKAFGFSEKTGIDLPGEANDIFFELNNDGSISELNLAVASFGQNFSITPIQLVTAISAVANGGKLMQPYIVSQVLDGDGNVVSTTEPTVRRDVISEETSRELCEMLEQNAISGAAKNGYVAGYRVCGKTGTSETHRDVNNDKIDDYIASFCGFCPADDPQYALLVYYDTPLGDSYYGSAVSAPVFKNIMTEVLPYLEVEPQYTQEELENMNATAGVYINMSVNDAKTAVERDDFTYITYGSGDTVVSQIPSAGSEVPKGGKIVLFTDNASESKTVTVPDLTGMTMAEANRSAAMYNLNINISGATTTGTCISYTQDIAAGTKVQPGTVITVSFIETAVAD